MPQDHTATIKRVVNGPWWRAYCSCGWDSVGMKKTAAGWCAKHHEEDPDPKRRLY